jgi:hypothetical protein
VSDDWRWWAIGLFVGIWLLITGRVRDWALLPIFVALGPLSVLFYVMALAERAIRKGEA